MAGRAVFPGAMPLRGEQGYSGERGTQGSQGIPGVPGTPGVVQAVQGAAPVVVGGTADTPIISMPEATAAVPGYMSVAYAFKLDSIAPGATAYAHPANHPPAIITQDANNRFVTDAEKTTWNGKQAALGFTPENAANKGALGGYPGLSASRQLLLKNTAGTFTSTLDVEDLTANRAISIQDKVGYLAMVTDITGGTRAGSFTTLTATGTFSATSNTASLFGPGGTGTNNGTAYIDGSSASSYGAQLHFRRNGVTTTQMGQESGINGGASNDFAIYTGAASLNLYGGGVKTAVVSSTGLAVTGLLDLSAATSGQIKFPATQNASADANTLDDYEEGTWTPTQGGGLTVVGAFASNGTYTKTGRQVHVVGSVSGATSVAATAGGILCAGLPFASAVYGGSVATNALQDVTAGTFVSVSNVYITTSISATGAIYFSAAYTV